MENTTKYTNIFHTANKTQIFTKKYMITVYKI